MSLSATGLNESSFKFADEFKTKSFFSVLCILFAFLLFDKDIQRPLVNPDKIMWPKIESGLIFPD